MIEIKFKVCCQNCPNLELDYDEYSSPTKKLTVIYCQHMKVCGDYKEAEKDDAIT